MTTTLDRQQTATILHAVINTQHPRLALPTIAANNDLTLDELQQLLKRHGYPDKQVMRKWWGKLLQDEDAEDAGADRDNARWRDLPGSVEPRRDPYIAALPVSALFADDSYQRELDEARVQRMVTAYDPALVGIIEVSHRPNDTYAILDGQHRWAATKDHLFGTADVPHIACRVHTGLTPAEESKLYHQLNTTRKQLTGWDRWKSRRSAGDPAVLAIEETVTAAGFTVSYRLTRGHITATSALEKVHNLGGTPLLGEVLDVVRSAWRDDPEAVTSGILQGLGHILTSYGRDELDMQRLVEALAGIVPRQLNARAAATREVHKGTLDKLTAHVMIEQYNETGRSGRVDAFFVRVKPLSPNKGTHRAAEVERAAAIKKWALEQGVIASERSHVTKAVREAYDEAHRSEGAA